MMKVVSACLHVDQGEDILPADSRLSLGLLPDFYIITLEIITVRQKCAVDDPKRVPRYHIYMYTQDNGEIIPFYFQ